MRSEDVVREDFDGDEAEHGAEAWHFVTDEPSIFAVEAGRFDDEPRGWQVNVAVMEFIRESDAPYADLRLAIEGAIADVAGVTGFHREDNEVWWVAGSPSGEELTRAVAKVLDNRADLLRTFYNDLFAE